MATRKTRTSKAKTDTTGADITASISITETDADVQQRETHNNNIAKVAKVKGDNIPQGKALNDNTFEYVCTDCLDRAAAKGDIYCLYDKPLQHIGRCSCGKITTIKAILI